MDDRCGAPTAPLLRCTHRTAPTAPPTRCFPLFCLIFNPCVSVLSHQNPCLMCPLRVCVEWPFPFWIPVYICQIPLPNSLLLCHCCCLVFFTNSPSCHGQSTLFNANIIHSHTMVSLVSERCACSKIKSFDWAHLKNRYGKNSIFRLVYLFYFTSISFSHFQGLFHPQTICPRMVRKKTICPRTKYLSATCNSNWLF